MTNTAIHEILSGLIKCESQITAKIIIWIAEADRRKMYLEYGCTSLFAYLRMLGYSPACAQRRIDAARLQRHVPTVASDLESGALNFSQISVVARGLKGKKVSIEVKQQLLDQVRHTDVRATEIAVSQILGIKPEVREKIHFQQDGSVRAEVTFTKEQWELFQKVKETISHTHVNPKISEVFELGLQAITKQRGMTSARKSRRVVFEKYDCCQWRDETSGKICGSKFQLQVDHIVPKWAGGTNAPENLQILCSTHNRLKYEHDKYYCSLSPSNFQEFPSP